MLESITFETLHAHNFTRSSSQATLVLTDLLSRYLTLLSAGCAKYAEHAGRLKLTVRDAVSALDELGVGVDELNEYCASEARDISRYAVHTARRIEDLNEFKGQSSCALCTAHFSSYHLSIASLEVGLKEDRDDLIPLVYAPMPSSTPSDEDEASSESDEETVGGTEREEDTAIAIGMDKIIREDEAGMSRRDYITSLLPPSSPPLPPSPISNPSTPPRKRARTSSWNPPPHIPDFLPPFPTDSPRHSPSLPPQNTSIPINHVKLERPPSPPPPQLSTSSSSADYLTPTPYSLSTLASTPSWHLPSAPAISPESADRAPPRSAGPPVQPALIGAYHHVLTHPPPPNVTSVNPARYKVALAFLAQSEVHPRWEPAATLFSNTAPNPPRVASMGPTYAMPVDKFPPTPTEGKAGKEQDLDKDKKSNLPSVPPKPIATSERITPLTSQQASRIPNLARQVLPVSHS